MDDYYGESRLDREKDDEILMTQKLLLLDDEFGGKSKKDAEKIKRLLSSNYFDLRPPYGAENIKLKRISVLCGTSNPIEVLNDPTGNRRLVVFEVTDDYNRHLFNSIDKEQLLAQLKALYDQGERADLDRILIEQMESLTSSKYSENSVELDLLQKFYLPANISDIDSFSFTTFAEIKDYIESNTRQILNARRLGLELTKLGYKKGLKVVGKKAVRGYYITKCN